MKTEIEGVVRVHNDGGYDQHTVTEPTRESGDILNEALDGYYDKPVRITIEEMEIDLKRKGEEKKHEDTRKLMGIRNTKLYQVWVNIPQEGWMLYEFDTLEEALASERYGNQWILTKTANFEVVEGDD